AVHEERASFRSMTNGVVYRRPATVKRSGIALPFPRIARDTRTSQRDGKLVEDETKHVTAVVSEPTKKQPSDFPSGSTSPDLVETIGWRQSTRTDRMLASKES